MVATETEEEAEADQARGDQKSSEKEDASHAVSKDISRGIAQTQEAAEDHQCEEDMEVTEEMTAEVEEEEAVPDLQETDKEEVAVAEEITHDLLHNAEKARDNLQATDQEVAPAQEAGTEDMKLNAIVCASDQPHLKLTTCHIIHN